MTATRQALRNQITRLHIAAGKDIETIHKQQTAIRAALEKLETGHRLLRNVETQNYSTDLAGGRNCVVNAMDDLRATLFEDEALASLAP